MHFRVRKAETVDADAACAAVRRSIQECCGEDHRGDPGILAAWLANKTPENLRSWIQSHGHVVVAELSGNIVGVAMLSREGTIVLNYLVPEAHSQGLGSAMLAALEGEARRRGLEELELYSTATAHQFYVRKGYVETGKRGSAFGLSSRGMRKILGRLDEPGRSSDSTVADGGVSPGHGSPHA